MAAIQDRAPPGGFAEFKYARSLPARGPGGTTLFLLGALAIGGGMCVLVPFVMGFSQKQKQNTNAQFIMYRAVP
jgi:hypothetical protein